MRSIILAALGVAVALTAGATPALAAAPCNSVNAVVRGLDENDVVTTGRSTTAITISGQSEGEISNVVASVPAPAGAQATLTAPGKVALAMNLPSAGRITLTLSWDELTHDTPPGSNESVVTCTQTTRIPLRVARPAALGVAGEETGFVNGVVAEFVFPGCRALLVAAPVTVTVRYRLGPKRRAYGPVPIPAAPTARSPKLVLVLARPCGPEKFPTQRATLPGRGSVSIGPGERPLAVVAKRRFAGRGAYGAHYIVEFAQPSFRTVRFDVTGYFSLGAGGKASASNIRRLR